MAAGDSRGEPGPRRQAREAALQVLYALDTAGETDTPAIERQIHVYWAHLEGPPAGRTYADALVQGVMATRTRLDEAIRATQGSWRIERMACVDRNVLRISAWEMLESDVPASVAIDEAVELAKRFGGEDSGAFVNGLLDRLARANGKL